MPAAGQSHQGLWRLRQWCVVGDDVRGDVLPLGGKKRQRLAAETIAVPQMAGPARHSSYLSAVQAEAIVVKLFPQSDFLASRRVERQIDDRALGAHDAQGQSQGAVLTAALEHDIGSAVAGPMATPAFQHDGWVGVARIDGFQAEVSRDLAARRRGVDKHY